MLVLLTCMTLLGVEAYYAVYDGQDYTDFNEQAVIDATSEDSPKKSFQILKDAFDQILPKYKWNEYFKTIREEAVPSEKSSKLTTTKQLVQKLETNRKTRAHWHIPRGYKGKQRTPRRTTKTFEQIGESTSTSNITKASYKSLYFRRTTEPIEFFHDLWMGFEPNTSLKTITPTVTRTWKVNPTTTHTQSTQKHTTTHTQSTQQHTTTHTQSTQQHTITNPIIRRNRSLVSRKSVMPSSEEYSRLASSITDDERSSDVLPTADVQIYDSNSTFTEDDDEAKVLMPDEDFRRRFSTYRKNIKSDESYIRNIGGILMGKCYVCGLTDEKIPYNSNCNDVFATFPHVPFDVSVRGDIKKYKKHCRWDNIDGYKIEEKNTEIMLGRFTGGCSVRWVDVSGIYTQRTCRNRHQPIMGKHWASKRMAELELALQFLDDGCIISPTASLLPLSRAISLYARFHVCVCTEHYCNAAVFSQQWSAYTAVFTFVAIFLWCN